MKDLRFTQLAEQLVRYSVSLQPGEHLLIGCSPQDLPLAKELIRAAYRAGGYPHVSLEDAGLRRCLLEGLQEEQAAAIAEYERCRFDRMDAYINLATTQNAMENAAVDPQKLREYARMKNQATQKMRQGRVKWCVCISPNDLYANNAGMCLDDFERYYFDVCCMDYARFGRAMEKLRLRMEQTDRVRILAPGTDLSFSIRGVPKCVSAGERNVPDGEVYTAPVRESVNGTIQFNVPSVFNGTRFEAIQLRFENGKAVSAQANWTSKLNEILDTDAGARYVGEFAFGLNPKLTVPLGLTLFDEKIRGSIHLAMGNALDLTDNGNRSAIHWDMVSLHTPEWGGGSVYFDDVLVRKDGVFVLPELEELNAQGFAPDEDTEKGR